MKQDNQNISVEELTELSVRAKNILVKNNFKKLNDIIDYYQSNLSFLGLRGTGELTNKELTDLCKNYGLKLKKNKELENEKKLINSLNQSEKGAINGIIKFQYGQLSSRAKTVLSNTLENELTVNRVFEKLIFNYNEANLLKYRNIGNRTIKELNNFVKGIKVYIEMIKSKKDDDLIELELFYNLLINYFPKADIGFIKNTINKNGEFRLFKLVDYLLKEVMYDKDDFNILAHTLNIYLDSRRKTLSQIANQMNLSRERIRQFRGDLYLSLDINFKMFSCLDKYLEKRYNLNFDDDIIQITPADQERINQSEGTRFSNIMINKIIYNFVYDTHSVIGDEENLFKYKNVNYKFHWQQTYLIKKELVRIFDFDGLLNDISNKINSKISETYEINFKSYLSKYLKKSELNRIFEISEICKFILRNELGVKIKNKKIIFKRNTKTQYYEIAWNILEKANKPLKADEIYSRALKEYPNLRIKKNSLKVNMRMDKGFIYFGRTSTFGLKRWEKQFEGIKGGTIRSMVRELLEKESKPLHITQIEDYVNRYRSTNTENIKNNLRREESNDFVFFNQSFIGLNSKINTKPYQKYFDIPKLFGKILRKLITKTGEHDYQKIVNHLSEKLKLEKNLIEILIEYQIKQGFITRENDFLMTNAKNSKIEKS